MTTARPHQQKSKRCSLPISNVDTFVFAGQNCVSRLASLCGVSQDFVSLALPTYTMRTQVEVCGQFSPKFSMFFAKTFSPFTSTVASLCAHFKFSRWCSVTRTLCKTQCPYSLLYCIVTVMYQTIRSLMHIRSPVQLYSLLVQGAV